MYRGDAAGARVSTAFGPLTRRTRAWVSPALNGQLYGEPFGVFGNDVYVATESDTVYALNATRGSVVWSRHFANPVPSTDLPCGNIAPTRRDHRARRSLIPSRNEIFVVADELARTVFRSTSSRDSSTKNGASRTA